MTAHPDCQDAGLGLDDGTAGGTFIHPDDVGMIDDPEILMVRREPGDTP